MCVANCVVPVVGNFIKFTYHNKTRFGQVVRLGKYETEGFYVSIRCPEGTVKSYTLAKAFCLFVMKH